MWENKFHSTSPRWKMCKDRLVAGPRGYLHPRASRSYTSCKCQRQLRGDQMLRTRWSQPWRSPGKEQIPVQIRKPQVCKTGVQALFDIADKTNGHSSPIIHMCILGAIRRVIETWSLVATIFTLQDLSSPGHFAGPTVALWEDILVLRRGCPGSRGK